MSTDYTASSIKALSQHEHLLKRISLTFGAETGDDDHKFSSQKTVAIREVVDNAMDEIRAGHGNHVKVTFFKDGSVEVHDSGRGLPVDVGKDSEGREVSGIYLTLGVIQSGGKFSSDANRFSSGMNGVGSSSSIHLSKRTDVTVYRDGKEHTLSFKDGTPGFFSAPDDPDAKFKELSDYRQIKTRKDPRSAKEKKNYETGTKIRIWLRDEVFSSEHPIDVDDLIERLRGTAILVPQLTVHVVNELRTFKNPETGVEDCQRETYHYDNGLEQFIDEHQSKPRVGEIIHLTGEGSFTERDSAVLMENGKIVRQDVEKRVPIEIALSWDEGYEYSMNSYVNTIRTALGGVHESAFEKALVSVLNERFSTYRGVLPKNITPTFEDYKEGLTVIFSVNVSEPEFKSQTKEELGGRALSNAIFRVLEAELEKFVKMPKNNNQLRAVAEKVAKASKARHSSMEARLAKRKANQVSSSAMPAKLADCAITGEEESELLIVEGDSAKGTIMKARDATFQAVMPIRGKVLNSYKANLTRIMANKEITGIATALGAGFGKNFDIDKIRYGKVLFASDADVDGLHINILLYAVFYRLFRPMIEEGRVYQTVPPLYEISYGGANPTVEYASNDGEMLKITRKLKARGVKYKVERSKGLGSMDPQSFSDTVLNPASRTLRRITLEDAKKAEEALELTLGDNSEERKDFIGANFEKAVDSGLVKGFENGMTGIE